MTSDRRGTPSPLPYYLLATASAHLQAAMQTLGPIRDDLWTADQVNNAAHHLDGTSFLDVIDAAILREKAMLNGISAWQNCDYRRQDEIATTVWSVSGARLLDYGGDGVPTLVVPSLINRAYILDLMPGSSFLECIRAQGLHPFLLDWGNPFPLRNDWDLSDHVSRILVPVAHFLHGVAGRPVGVLGYCMGGTLCVALSQCAATAVDRLVVLGAPWQFDVQTGVAVALKEQIGQLGLQNARLLLHQIGNIFGAVPSDFFQLLFAMIAPMQAVQKFSRFASMDPKSIAAKKFVAIEQWLNDGVSLPASSAIELLIDWYVGNSTASGNWIVDGNRIAVESLPCPTLGITGNADHIVPPDVAVPVGKVAPQGQDFEVAAGHVGMIVGRKAHAEVAYRLCSFLSENRLS